MLKKILKSIAMIAAVVVITAGYPLSARAAGEIQVKQIMTAMQKIDAKAEPDSNAETIYSYDAGSSVLVTGETQDGWYIVYYQGKIGYVDQNTPVDPSTFIGTDNSDEPNTPQKVLVEQEIDVAALDAEMEALQIEDQIIVEEVERYREEARRSKIWGIVIVVLVIAIFAVGIVSTVLAEKKKKEDENTKENIIDLDKE